MPTQTFSDFVASPDQAPAPVPSFASFAGGQDQSSPPPKTTTEDKPAGYSALKLAPDPTPTAQDRFTRTPMAFGQTYNSPDQPSANTSYKYDLEYPDSSYSQGPASLIEANTGPDPVVNSRMLRHESIHAMLSSSAFDYQRVLKDPVLHAASKPIIKALKDAGYKLTGDNDNIFQELPAYMGSFSNSKDEWTSGVTPSMRNNYIAAFTRALAKQDPQIAAKYQRMLIDSSPGTVASKVDLLPSQRIASPDQAVAGAEQFARAAVQGPTISALPAPSLLDRAKGVVMGDVRTGDTALGRATGRGTETVNSPTYKQPAPLVRFESAVPEKGIARGVAEAATGLADPANLELIAGTAGLGEAAPVLSKLLAAGFSAQMLHGVYQQIPEFRDAVHSGDWAKARQVAARMATGSGLAALGLKHASKDIVAGARARVADKTEAPQANSTGQVPGQSFTDFAKENENAKSSQRESSGSKQTVTVPSAQRSGGTVESAKVATGSSGPQQTPGSQGQPVSGIANGANNGPDLRGGGASTGTGLQTTVPPHVREGNGPGAPVSGLHGVRETGSESGDNQPEPAAGGEGENRRRVTGSADIPLNGEGKQQAADLAARVGKADRTFHAPNLRSQETAHTVDAGAKPADWLEPWRLGAHEGKPLDSERDAINDRVVNNPDSQPGVSPHSGEQGESFNEVRRRLISGAQDQAEAMPHGSSVLNVTSGRALQIIDAWAKTGNPADNKVSIPAMTADSEFSKPGQLFRLDPGGLNPVDKIDGAGQYFAQHGATEWNTSAKVPRGTSHEQGAASLDLLTLGVKPFIEQDVAPALSSVASGIRDSADDILKILSPTLRSRIGQSAGLIFRGKLGELARKSDQARYALKQAEGFFGRQKTQFNFDFIDRYENHQPQPNVDLQVIDGVLRKLYDGRRADVQNLGTGKLQTFYQDYFAHLWEKPNRAKTVFAAFFGKRPLEGSKSFLKQRKYPTVADGLAAGLRPVSDNPVTLTLLKLQEMDRYVMAHETLNDWKAQGIAQFLRLGAKAPADFRRIDDPIGASYRKNAAGELILNGHWYAHESAAQLLNNHLGTGFTRFALFRAATGLNNVMNLFNLGLSGFHITKTAWEATVSKGAIGLEQIYRGHPIKGIGNIVAAPAAPFTSYVKGSKMLQEWYRPGSQGGAIGSIMDGLTTGGARARMDQMYRTSIAESMLHAAANFNLPGAAARAPFAGMEAITRVIMDEFVPRMKMGSMAEMAAADMARLGPNASFEDVQRIMTETVNSIDNRMGEVARDNLFWNRYARDLSMFLMRADQYFLGTVREVGGGLVDLARQPIRAAQGKPVNLKRISYIQSMLMYHMAAAAIYQYLHTRKWPEEGKDWFYPKNGQLDESGHSQRTALWSYVKDIHGFERHPINTLENKAAPSISLFSDLIHNEDFYHTEISHPDDPPVEQAGEVAKFVATQFEPRSIENFEREQKLGAPIETQAEQFFGLSPAPAEINQSPAERMSHQISAARAGDEPRTAEAAARRELRQSLSRSLRAGKGVPAAVIEASRNGKLSKNDRVEAVRAARRPPLVNAFMPLSIEDALRVYRIATPEEKAELRPFLLKKRTQAFKTSPPADRARIAAEIRTALQ